MFGGHSFYIFCAVRVFACGATAFGASSTLRTKHTWRIRAVIAPGVLGLRMF